MEASPPARVIVRNTGIEDVDGIVALSRRVYVGSPPWTTEQLRSHLDVFPEGQLVAVTGEGNVVGMAASLIVLWNDYSHETNWRDFTDRGYFRNHDPERGMTLYGAEIMVDPELQGLGIGKQLYEARRDLCVRLKLKRIRAGARLRGYHLHAREMSAEEYVIKVIHEELGDPTLSFQLKQGFDVLAVVQGYLSADPESLGWAALIEWTNPDRITPQDLFGRDPRFARPVSP